MEPTKAKVARVNQWKFHLLSKWACHKLPYLNKIPRRTLNINLKKTQWRADNLIRYCPANTLLSIRIPSLQPSQSILDLTILNKFNTPITLTQAKWTKTHISHQNIETIIE